MLLIIGLLGLCVGSFINALVWRLHEQGIGYETKVKRTQNPKPKAQEPSLSIARGRSMCPNCKHELAWFDLVPVASWMLLRGRCRYCHKPISMQYPLVEILTAGLFLLSYWRLAPITAINWVIFAAWLYVLGSLIALAVYDLRWMLLPDVIIFPAMVVAVLVFPLELFAGAPLQALLGPIIAAFVAGGFFYLLAAVSKGRWMGGGDIKLVFLMGLILGLRKLGVGLFVAFDTAAIVGLTLLALRLRKRSELIPFGPFLVLGTLVAVLYGQTLIGWYLRVSGINLL